MFAQTASALLAMALVGAAGANAQVTATGTMGTTNPAEPTLGTDVNQTSYSRLITVNSIDDFCLFAPPEAGASALIGDTEAIEVAWCVQPRNNARVIPDGTLQAVHFVKTPLYVQVQGWGDFTKINIVDGDEVGELDPHGATGLGNPVGGNVTSNITGSDVHYEEWMNYMSYQQFCIRICTAENDTYSAAEECQHTLDEMGCNWVMPGDYTNGSFTSCEADAAFPPGVYPLSNGSTSTFAQRYTGTYTATDGATNLWTVGETSTPQTAASTPASSNCVTYTSVGNGIASLASGATISGASGSSVATASASATGASSAGATSGAAAGSSGSGSSAKTAAASASGSSSGSSASGSSSAAFHSVSGETYGMLFTAGVTAFTLVAGAGAMFL